MGLLDFLPDDPDQRRAVTQGLLSGAFGAMAGRGSRLQAFGQGGLSGLAGYSSSLDRTAQEKERAAQMQRQALQDQLLKFQIGDQQRQSEINALPGQFLLPGIKPATMDDRDVGQPGEAPIPAQQFDQQGYLTALQAKNPMLAAQYQAAIAKDDAPIKLGAGESLFDKRTLKPLATNPKTPDLPSALQEYNFAVQQGYKGTFTDWDKDRKRSGASSVNVGLQTPVQAIGPDGTPIYVQPANKPGAAPQVLNNADGTPIRPPLNESEKKAQQKITDAKDAIGVIGDIRTSLGTATSGVLQDLSNKGLGAFGVATDAAKSDAKLNVLSSKLVALVPRFEGPQSDADTKLYRQAAGDLANPFQPREVRLAALETVEALHRKAAGMNSPKKGDTTTNVDDLVNKYRSK